MGYIENKKYLCLIVNNIKYYVICFVKKRKNHRK